MILLLFYVILANIHYGLISGIDVLRMKPMPSPFAFVLIYYTTSCNKDQVPAKKMQRP